MERAKAKGNQATRRRQARGARRIEVILDAGAQLFAEMGFEASTTNAIAARAGMSPGSLYQFFPNKDAIAEALAARYRERLRATQETAFAPEIAALPLDEMINRVVDPLVTFQTKHPEFHALWAGSDVSPRLAEVMQEFHEAVVDRAESILAARSPRLPPDRLNRYARVSVQLVKGLLLLVAAAEPAEHSTLVGELKAVERAYLAPDFGSIAAGPVISLMLAVPEARAAAEWYHRALGAAELWNLGSVVGLEIEGAPFFLAETDNNGWDSPTAIGTTTVRVEVFVDDPDAFIERAIEAGANGSQDQVRDHQAPWGIHRQGGFYDPFGHLWLVGDKSPLSRFQG